MAGKFRSLVDRFGRTVSAAVLQTLGIETSAPGAIHGRSPFGGHLAFGIDPHRLGQILQSADNGNTLGWQILAQEIEELFPHYAAVMGKRRRQVAELPITVRAAEGDEAFEVHAELVRQWIGTGALKQFLFDMTDAIGKGFSVGEIIWDCEPDRVWPCEIIYLEPRHIEISPQDGRTLKLRTEAGLIDLAPHKFVQHIHKSKSGPVVRSGLTRAVAWLFLYASYNAKDWALFCQGYGMPIRVGRYGPEASDADKRVLWEAVSSIAGDAAALIPKSMEIEFVRDGDRAAGASLYLGRADWLNREVSKLVLGGTAGTDAVNGGHAVGKEHRDVEQDVEFYDAGLLSNTINRQIIPDIIAFTFGPQAAYPSVLIGRPDQVPLAELADAMWKLGPLGLQLKASEVRDRLQMTKPNPDDEVIGGRPAAVPLPTPAAPAVPPPPGPVSPPEPARMAALSDLIARHTQATPDLVEAMTARLAADAAGALHGLTDHVKHAIMGPGDLHDAADRLAALKLPPKQFAEAMARGMALANLVGQATVLAELHAEPARHTTEGDA